MKPWNPKEKSVKDKDSFFISPWLDELSFDWSLLEQLGTRMEVPKNQILFHQHQPVESIYLVKQGRIRLYMLSKVGDEKAVAIIGKNGLLGESSFFLKNGYLTGAITNCETTVYKIEPGLFQKTIMDSPLYIRQLFEMMSLKIRLLYEHTLHLSYTSSYHRVCQAFVQLGLTYGEKEGQHIKIKIPFTHQELANLVGATRVTVANHVKNLIEHRIISKPARYYIIENIEELMSE